MGIAHICRQCGEGLGRIRPQLDPYYDLPIVTCPRCQGASVRRKPQASLAWKNFLRRGWVFGVITKKIIISVMLFTFMIAGIGGLYSGEFEVGRNVTARGYWIVLTLLLVVLPVTTGAWLTFAFSHLKRWKVFTTWAILVSVVLLIIATGLGISGEADGISNHDEMTLSVTVLAWMGIREVFPPCLGLLALMMAVSTGGIPLGRVGLAARRVLAGWHWRWLLRRRRLRRSLQ